MRQLVAGSVVIRARPIHDHGAKPCQAAVEQITDTSHLPVANAGPANQDGKAELG